MPRFSQRSGVATRRSEIYLITRCFYSSPVIVACWPFMASLLMMITERPVSC